jgi:hypothetical protein
MFTRKHSWYLFVLLSFALPLPALAQEPAPWALVVQLGGTPASGEVAHYYNGKRINTGHGGDELNLALDLRGTVSRAYGKYLALSGQVGLTNWDSGYRFRAGYDRNNALTVALSPELRLPLGSCTFCPRLYAGPRAGFAVAGGRDARTHNNGPAKTRANYGWVVGGRLGIALRVRKDSSYWVTLEGGYEKTYFQQRVRFSDGDDERRRFVMSRWLGLVGFWWGS